MRPIVNLIVQQMLHEVALLFTASCNLHPSIVDRNRIIVQLGQLSKVLDLVEIRLSMGRGTQTNLSGRTDVADFPDTVMTIVICHAMRECHPARRLSKDRPAAKRRQDATLNDTASKQTRLVGLDASSRMELSKEPRIIAKFFAAECGFAGDYDAKYLPVMGHIWFPDERIAAEGDDGLSLRDILAAYVALFNSSPFVKLLQIFSPHVAGGQFDLIPAARTDDSWGFPNR
jgi:hypothetical protein